MKSIDYSLYLVTDRSLMSSKTLEEAVESAILGGVTLVQLREKELSSREFYDTAVSIKAICDKYNVPLIINDRLDIALAVNAAGLHIGQKDIPLEVARKILGNDKIIGVSASTLEQSIEAFRGGADYLGVGAMYSTATKTDANSVSIKELREIISAVNIPVVIIGGINKARLADFKNINIAGCAVVSAVIAADEIKAAASDFLCELNAVKGR